MPSSRSERKLTSALADNSPQKRLRELQTASKKKFQNAVQKATDEFYAEHPDIDIKGYPALDEKDIKTQEAFASATQRALMHLSIGLGNKVQNDDELTERIYEYFTSCVGIKNIPTLESLTLSLGMTPMWFDNVISGREIGFTTTTREILLAARTTLASIMSDLALQNKIGAVPYIFYGKNFLGMVDKKEVDINVNLGQKSASQLIAEANALPQLTTEEVIEAEYTDTDGN